jgi:hypothetical protein
MADAWASGARDVRGGGLRSDAMGTSPASDLSTTRGRRGRRAGVRILAVAAGLATLAVAASIFAAPGSSLQTGRQLLPKHSLRSPNGRFTLDMRPDGNLVEYMGSRAVWSSRTRGNPGARAVMQPDGNFVVKSARGRRLWTSRTGGHHVAPYRLSIETDGNVVVSLYGTVAWTNRARQPGLSTPDTGNYPYPTVPCIWAPYAVYGTGYWCRGYNWGTIRNKATAASEESPYGYPYRNCTDFVAWKLTMLGVPPGRFLGLGNANTWGTHARAHGVRNDSIPAAGAVAVTTTGQFGHVAFVTRVVAGRITVVQYDRWQDGAYSTQTGTPRALGLTSFDHFEIYER